MCRLFGLSAAPRRVTATFWLLDAPDSLAVQSRREPDGVGLGVFEPDGSSLVHKRPIAAYQDIDFARQARQVAGTTFLAHVRYASTGGLRVENTHHFCKTDACSPTTAWSPDLICSIISWPRNSARGLNGWFTGTPTRNGCSR